MLYPYYYTCMSSSFSNWKCKANKKPDRIKKKIQGDICTSFSTSLLYNLRKQHEPRDALVITVAINFHCENDGSLTVVYYG